MKKAKKNSRTNKNQKGTVASFVARFGRTKVTAVAAVVIFALIGSYLVFFTQAMVADEVLLSDQPDRGIVYNGQKVKNKGPCKGGFDITSSDDEKKNGKDAKKCTYVDPGPADEDIRKRAARADSILADIAKRDEIKKPFKSDDPSVEAPATITGADMSDLGGRAFPCIGSGTDGKRVQALYVYPADKPNRLETLRPGFTAIGRRVNQIFYASGQESGGARQVRFQTFTTKTGGCDLSITAVAIPADYLHGWTRWLTKKDGTRYIDYSGIDRALERKGFSSDNRKYMVWVDFEESYTPCGQGTHYGDTKATLDNLSNTRSGYAVSWKGCWNYAEPHELMHNLGAVQSSDETKAPYSTRGGHCYDEWDVMCYDDDDRYDSNGNFVEGIQMIKRCTADIDKWRFDCGNDTYFRGAPATTGWLSKYWNTANSGFLHR